MAVREPLTPERIVDAAVVVADGGGLAAVSMRAVGRRLGVEAMSLYHHVAGKEALLDDLADWVFSQVELPPIGAPWRQAMTARAGSARRVLGAHPWALRLVESRPPGPALLRHHDTVLGCLRADGFSVWLAAHAFSVIDAYVYGFVLTEQNVGVTPEDRAADTGGALAGLPDYPHLAEMFTDLVLPGDYVFAREFDYGLEVVLDGLEQRRVSKGEGAAIGRRGGRER